MPVVLAKAEAERVATGKEDTRWTVSPTLVAVPRLSAGTIAAINSVPRYIACSRVTKRPIFDSSARQSTPTPPWSSSRSPTTIPSASFIRPPLGLVHREMLDAQGRFPLHLRHGVRHVPLAASADYGAGAGRCRRRRFLAGAAPEVMAKNDWSLRDLYRTLDLPGKNPLRDARTTGYGRARGLRHETQGRSAGVPAGAEQGSGGAGDGGRRRDAAGAAALRGKMPDRRSPTIARERSEARP